MAAPTRIFVGVFVFSLIASLAVVPFTILVLTNYQPPGSIPLVEPSTEYGMGHKAALVMASAFTLGFVVVSWRALLGGARRDAEVRRQRNANLNAVEVGGDGRVAASSRDEAKRTSAKRDGARADSGDEQPPGYG